MEAGELIEKFVKEDQKENVSVIAIGENKGKPFWWHVHRDEELPDKGERIAIIINKNV